MRDILRELGHVALGSRLKRLAERLQADAAQMLADGAFPMQPGHFPLLAALDRYGPLTVGEAVEALGVSQPAVTRSLSGLERLGLAETRPSEEDRRRKTIALTGEGEATIGRMKAEVWPGVRRAVEQLCAAPDGDLLDHIGRFEAALDAASLATRAGRAAGRRRKRPRAGSGPAILDYTDDLADAFFQINQEWIDAMFEMEEADRRVLLDPRGAVVDRGGVILFASLPRLGVVGTCALMRVEPGCFELTKMGVLEKARGRGIGDALLAAILARAKAMDVETLFLLTNAKCQAAIHLYERFGFHHDPAIMARFGTRYARCNVAMSYPLR